MSECQRQPCLNNVVVYVPMAAGVTCVVVVADFIGTASGRHVVGTGKKNYISDVSKLSMFYFCFVESTRINQSFREKLYISPSDIFSH